MKKWIDRFASVKLFYTLMALLIALCVLGSVIPQGESAEKYTEMFGLVFGKWVLSLRLGDVFRSPLFGALLALAAVNFVACTFSRWEKSKRRPGVIISHAAVLIIFLGGGLRALMSERGYLPLKIGQTSQTFYLNNGQTASLPFTLGLKDFRIDYWQKDAHRLQAAHMTNNTHEEAALEMGRPAVFKTLGITVTPVRFYPHFVMSHEGPATIDESPENPAIELRVREGGQDQRRFVFAHYGDIHADRQKTAVRFAYAYVPGRVKQFASRLVVQEDGREVLDRTIQVNNPMTYKGYRFFQSGYDPKDSTSSTLQVSKDPSVVLVYAGFALLMLGVGWSFLQKNSKEA